MMYVYTVNWHMKDSTIDRSRVVVAKSIRGAILASGLDEKLILSVVRGAYVYALSMDAA